MSPLMEIARSSGDKVCFFLPHAGGAPHTAYVLQSFLSRDYGLSSVDYESQYVCEVKDYISLCTKLAAQMLPVIRSKKLILIGSSYGAYICFSIAQYLEYSQQTRVEKIIMTSVGESFDVIKKISSGINYEDLIESYYEIPDSMKQETIRNVKRDIDVLKTLKMYPFKISSPIKVCNGLLDSFCHSKRSEIFWSNQSTGDFEYCTYPGGHIPQREDWQVILDGM